MNDIELWPSCRKNLITLSNFGLLGDFELAADSEASAKEWRYSVAHHTSYAIGVDFNPNQDYSAKYVSLLSLL